MKINERVALSTSKLILVPYESHHVPNYHFWMQDQDLQTATASEALTLGEEHSMQRSWRTDHGKLTFIVCLPLKGALTMDGSLQRDDDGDDHVANHIEPGEHDSSDRMLGDINLFFYDIEDDEGDVQRTSNDNNRCDLIGEIELMIARQDLQHQGYGRAALIAFMSYILSSWQEIGREYAAHQQRQESPRLVYLRAKINQSNARSIRLFESVGFEMVGEGPNYFGEVELRWIRDVGYLEGLGWFERPSMLRYGR